MKRLSAGSPHVASSGRVLWAGRLLPQLRTTPDTGPQGATRGEHAGVRLSGETTGIIRDPPTAIRGQTRREVGALPGLFFRTVVYAPRFSGPSEAQADSN